MQKVREDRNNLKNEEAESATQKGEKTACGCVCVQTRVCVCLDQEQAVLNVFDRQFGVSGSVM